jgi:hypothetical protein
MCLKIFPAYLLLVPLVRRDGRCLAGCAAGLVLGLGVVPVAALGPARTARCYRELGRVMLAPALGLGADASRAKELLEVTATDNVCFQVLIHNALHPDRDARPNVAASWVRRAHLGLAAGLTLLTLAAARRRLREGGPALVLFVGALTLVMLLSSPVCHSHYFALSVPLVMGLLAAAWERDAVTPLSWALAALLAVHVVGATLPLLPDQERFRDAGSAAVGPLLLWLLGCWLLARPGVAAPVRRPVPRPSVGRVPSAFEGWTEGRETEGRQFASRGNAH